MSSVLVAYHSVLMSSGFIQISNGPVNRYSDIDDYLNFTNENVSDLLLNAELDLESDLLNEFAETATPKLALEDFGYIDGVVKRAKQLLSGGLASKARGVNILLHGAPGTGKTELALALVGDAQGEAFFVPSENSEGNSLKANERINSLAMCHRVLKNRTNSVVIFDEIEDVFDASPFFSRVGSKAWWNQTLENNESPTIWISNKIDQMDAAYIRRFDLVLEISPPPPAIRREMLVKAFGNAPVSGAWVDTVSKNAQLTPAAIQRAQKVLDVASVAYEDYEKTMEAVLVDSYRALGKPLLISQGVLNLPYSLDYINCDQNVTRITHNVSSSGTAKLLMYGPPGVGKTEWSKKFAEEVGLELLEVRVSDVLSKWVGDSEKNIANIFQTAITKGQFLLFDEVDSLLRSRELSEQSWEVTQVNEFLTQLDRFEGYVACTTNCLDNLDRAAIRRFDFKLKFDYLTADSALMLATDVLEKYGKETEISDQIKSRLARLDVIAFGDFKVAVRRLHLNGSNWQAVDLVQELENECKVKRHGSSRPIGFLASVS